MAYIWTEEGRAELANQAKANQIDWWNADKSGSNFFTPLTTKNEVTAISDMPATALSGLEKFFGPVGAAVPKTDWAAVAKDPTNPLFGVAVQNNMEGLNSGDVLKYLQSQIQTQYDEVTNPEHGIGWQGWEKPTTGAALYDWTNSNGYNNVNNQLGAALDWLTKQGYTEDQLKPYYNNYLAATQYGLGNTERELAAYRAELDKNLGGWFGQEAVPVIAKAFPYVMAAVGGIGGAAAAGPIVGGAMGGAIGGMSGSDGNGGLLNTLGSGAKGAAIGAATGAVAQGLGAEGLDISGTVGDAAFEAGASDWVAQQAGQLTENIAKGTANGLIRNPSDPLGVLTNSAAGSITGAGIDAAKGFVGDTVKDLFSTSPDFTSYSNDLANQYFDGGIVNNTIDSFTPDSYWQSANPDLSQVTGQFLNNTASSSPFTDNYKGSLLNYDPNADPFKENFANATEGLSILGDGNKLVVDETLDDPLKYEDKKTSTTNKKTTNGATAAPSTAYRQQYMPRTKQFSPYEAYKNFKPETLADYDSIIKSMDSPRLVQDDYYSNPLSLTWGDYA